MAMPVTVPRYTIQDLESFPNDGNRYELLDGILLVTPAPAPLHQRVVSRLFGYLEGYFRSDRIAEVFSPGSVEVQPRLHLEPDILVVPANVLPRTGDLPTRWTDITAWWLAAEVSGESRMYDRDFKGPAYLAVGVGEYWRVDLNDRCLYVSRPGQEPEQRYAEEVTWLPPQRTESLVIPVPDLFP